LADDAVRPTYRELLARPGKPPGSTWGLWGDDDEVGALNLVTPDLVAAAARLVRRGAVFPLNWALENPRPALFGRGSIEHVKRDAGFGMDDHFDRFFPHGSSHWDSFGHFANPEHGYYGGRTPEQLKGPGAKNSIAAWARRGVAARFLLADVERWRAATGRPIAQGTPEAIGLADLRATLAAQGAEPQVGDVLLVRLGWVGWYGTLDAAGRKSLTEGGPAAFAAPGLAASHELVGWLWDEGVVAVAADCPALEAFPFRARGRSLHGTLLPLLGINIGEMFDLEALAADCQADGGYVGLFTSAPLNFTGATGSPANALALK
jgi:kynurenine formamidase